MQRCRLVGPDDGHFSRASDAVPGTRRVAVIGSRSFSENVAIFNAIRQAAQARGVEVFSKGPDLPVGTLTVPGASQPEMS